MLYLHKQNQGGTFTVTSARKGFLKAISMGLILQVISVPFLEPKCSRFSLLKAEYFMYYPVLACVNRFVSTLKHGDKQDCMLLHLLI